MNLEPLHFDFQIAIQKIFSRIFTSILYIMYIFIYCTHQHQKYLRQKSRHHKLIVNILLF